MHRQQHQHTSLRANCRVEARISGSCESRTISAMVATTPLRHTAFRVSLTAKAEERNRQAQVPKEGQAPKHELAGHATLPDYDHRIPRLARGGDVRGSHRPVS